MLPPKEKRGYYSYHPGRPENMVRNYQIINGTYYHQDTPDEVIEILEASRNDHSLRIRLHYGNLQTGQDWEDRYGVTGHVGRSMGTIKIPLMIANSRSLGGVGILDDCIVKIETAKNKRVLYQHPKYHMVVCSRFRSWHYGL